MNSKVPALLCLLFSSVLFSGEIDPAIAKKRREDALAWERKTSVEDYKAHGLRVPASDADAIKALDAMALTYSGNEDGLSQTTFAIFRYANSATQKGASDAIVLYAELAGMLQVYPPYTIDLPRYYMSIRMLTEMRASHYHIFRRAMGEAMLARVIAKLKPNEHNAEMDKEYSEALAQGRKFFTQCMADKDIPPDRISNLGSALLEGAVATMDREKALAWLLNDLAKEQRTSAPILALAVEVYTNYAWDARGHGYANTVTAEGNALMEKRLTIAANCGEQAFAADPYIRSTPVEMLSVELGQGQGRERLNLWFKRGVAVDPNAFNLYSSYMYYLEPKWYGSEKEMLAFAKAIASEGNWKGGLPLLVELAHRDIARYEADGGVAYFKRPEVWADIKNCFEPFLKRYPDACNERTQYCRLAFFCDQWDVVKEQRQILGDSFYGPCFEGQEELDRFKAELKRH